MLATLDMKHTLSLGEVNNRIILFVAAINVLIDYEFELKALNEELEALRKKTETYRQALKVSESRAYALRAKYAKLIAEVNQWELTRPQLKLRLAVAQRQHEAHPNAITSLLNACWSPPASPKASTASEPTTPPASSSSLIRKGYLHKIKERWQKSHYHFRPSAHATLRRAESHLTRLSAILALKRLESLRVQRGIRAAKENIKIELEEIEAHKKKLGSSLTHLYEDKYNEYCELLRSKIAEADTHKSHKSEHHRPTHELSGFSTDSFLLTVPGQPWPAAQRPAYP